MKEEIKRKISMKKGGVEKKIEKSEFDFVKIKRTKCMKN